jgi:DNA-binding transcriptional ArsR family regulator
MAEKKNHLFSENEQVLAGFLDALSHPARLQILRVLASRCECICGELVDVMPLAQSTVSQHLKVLKEANLITGEIDGPAFCYCLNEQQILERIKLFQAFIQQLKLNKQQKETVQCKPPKN